MTQEDKELLLKELCARLPYYPKCEMIDNLRIIDNEPNPSYTEYLFPRHLEIFYFHNNFTIKPYLRPMSSMTEEEKEELKGICSIYIPTDSKNIGFEDYGILVFTHHLIDNSYSFKLNLNVIDWLNVHHFDYRGLIPKDLAIEVTEENNPYKK